MLEVGFVLRAHGVRGTVRVRSGGDSLGSVRELVVGGTPYAVQHVQREREDWLVKLAGVDDRDQAEALKGKAVAIADAARPAPADDELYVADLVGCTLVDVAGNDARRGHRQLRLRRARGPRGRAPATANASSCCLRRRHDRRTSISRRARSSAIRRPGLVDLDEADSATSRS